VTPKLTPELEAALGQLEQRIQRCEWCSTVFVARRAGHRFCRPACQVAAFRAKKRAREAGS